MDSEDNFKLVTEKFLQSDASIIELTNSFTNLVAESKQKFDDGGRTAYIDILLDCIHKYLYCIIEYAEGGNALTRSVTLKQLCNRICTAVDQLKIEHEFVKNLSLLTFEFLFGQPSWIAKEILRMYSAIIQQCDKAVRTEVIQEKAPYYLGRLMDELPFGDFEFQLLIVEILFRISTKEVLNNMISMNFLTEEFREAFYQINTDEFDLTARSFLNLLNEAEKYVFSLLCSKVVFDDYRLQEPPELTSFKGLWVDFNVRAATVTLFINNESFNQDTKWEMITIFPENIAKVDVSYVFNEEKRKKEGIAKFALKGPCQLCYAAAQHKLLSCRSLTLHSMETEKFRETFNQAFPKIHKKTKQKQTTTLTHKRGYKPLDIVSVKSCATNPSTTFNVTLDSSVTGKRTKSKSVGGKSVTVADSTIISISSKSKTISSRKSLNLSLNHSNLLELEEKNEDQSLLSYKIKNLGKTCSSKMKKFVNFDDISSGSNLSVLEHVETGKDAERAVATQKMKLSGLDRLDNDMYKHEKSKERRFSEYNKEFLSNLIDIEDNEDEVSGYIEKSDKNLVKGGSFGASKSKLLKTEADSTTLIGGLYSSNLLIEDNESDEFQSIVDIDKKSSEHKTKHKSFGLKKMYAETKLNYKTLKNSKITTSSLDRSISGLSADVDSDLEKNKQKIRKTKLQTSKNKQRKKNTSKKITKNCRNMEMGSSLGVLLSPELFTLSNQDSAADNNENKIPKTIRKDQTSSCIIQNVSVSSLIHSTHNPHLNHTGAKKPLNQKYPSNEDSQQLSQESLNKNNSSTKKFDSSRTLKKCKPKLSQKDFKGYRILGDYPVSTLIDGARDCKLDEFDHLKLERPKNLSQHPKVEIPVEPELIEIPATKSQNPFSPQTELFETALTHLDVEETPSMPTTGRDLELFLDISQENACYKGSSEENSQEVNFSSNKLRIQVLSNIQIQPPISKLGKVSQDKGFTSTEEQDKMKKSDEINSSEQLHVIRAPTPDDQSTNSKKNVQDSAECQNSNDHEFEVIDTQSTSNSGGSSETYLSNENIIISSVEKCESDTKKETKTLDSTEEKVSKVKEKLSSQEEEKTMRKSIEKEVVKEVESNTEEVVQKKTFLKDAKLSNVDDDEDNIPLSELKHKIQTKTAHSQRKKCVSFADQCTEQSTDSPHAIRASTSDNDSSNSKEKMQDSTQKQIHDSNNDNFRVGESQTTSNSKYSSETNLSTENNDMKNTTKVVEVAPESPKKNCSQDEIIKKKLLMMLKDTELSNIDDEHNLPLSERRKLKKKTTHSLQRKLTFASQKKGSTSTEENDGIEKSDEKISSEHPTSSPHRASTPDKKSSNSEENVQDSIKHQIHDEFGVSETQNISNSKNSSETNLANENKIIGVAGKRGSDVKNKKKGLEMKVAPELPKKNFPEDVKIKKTLSSQKEGKKIKKSIEKVVKEVESNTEQEVPKKIMLQSTKLSNMVNDHEDDTPLSEIKQKLQKKPADSRPKEKVVKTMKKSIEKVAEEVESIAGQEVGKKMMLESTKLLNMMNDRKDDTPLSKMKHKLQKKISAPKENLLENEIIKKKLSSQKRGKKMQESIDKIEVVAEEVKSNAGQETEKKMVLDTKLSRMKTEDEDNIPLFKLKHKLQTETAHLESSDLKHSRMKSKADETNVGDQKSIEKPSYVFSEAIQHVEAPQKCEDREENIIETIEEDYSTTSPNKKRKDEVKIPTLRETATSNQTDENIKLKTSDSRKENDNEIIQKCGKNELKRSIERNKENENNEVRKKIPKMAQSNAQAETEIKQSDRVFDEVERSMSLLFDMENNEPIEKPVNLPTQKILQDTNRFANITANTTNSLTASNAGMLKRGRKLFSHENEEENFLNFTLVQEKNEEVNPVVKEPKKIRKKKDKDSRNSPEKSKNKRSPQKATKNHSEIRHKKDSTCINRSRPGRLDAFYDRVIEKLKTKNSSSRISHSVYPKVRRSENDRDGKYNLDFSLLKASFQKKQETAQSKSKFLSGQNESRDFMIQEPCHKDSDREEKNVICENQQEETDEILREILRNLGLLFRKIADGTLKKPSPSIQKSLLAAAAALIDL